MTKAVTKQIAAIIVFLILLVFGIIWVLQKLAPYLNIDSVFPWMWGQNTPSGPEAVTLQFALQCSYYRCVDGCDSDQVKRLKYSAEGIFFDCSDFCRAEFTDTGTLAGKICDDKAKTNPVAVSVLSSDGEVISLDKLKFAKCIIETDSCGSAAGFSQLVLVERSIVKPNTETVMNCATGHSLAGISKAIINVGSYKIWTNTPNALGIGGATHLCAS